MKRLLTIIILILTISITLLFIKRYAEESSTTTYMTTTKATPVKPNIEQKAKDILDSKKNNLDEKKIIKSKNNGNKVDEINVNKLVTLASSQGLKPKALKSALNAYIWALNKGKLGENKNTLTIVDFTLPSYEKRMWVLDLHQNKVLMKLHTTQGAGSGLVYASRFSNQSRTQASSLGLYTTSEKYQGKHGLSMRLNGLQKGINNNARNRAIVIHEAQYATPAYIRANHRAGRSWGCFAIDPASKAKLLNYVKGGSAFFAYARSIENTSIVSQGPISI